MYKYRKKKNQLFSLILDVKISSIQIYKDPEVSVQVSTKRGQKVYLATKQKN
jgi:hypothetical protein